MHYECLNGVGWKNSTDVGISEWSPENCEHVGR